MTPEITTTSAPDESSQVSLFDLFIVLLLIILTVWTGIVFLNACLAAGNAPTGKFGQAFNDNMPIWMQIFWLYSIYRVIPSKTK